MVYLTKRYRFVVPADRQSVKSLYRLKCRLQFLEHRIFRDLDGSGFLGVSYVLAAVEGICSLREHPSGLPEKSSVIVKTTVPVGSGGKHKFLRLSRCQFRCLFEVHEHSSRHRETVARSAGKEHHGLLSGKFSRIRYGSLYGHFRAVCFKAQDLHVKLRIGKSEAERIEDLLRSKCREETVSYEDILCVEVLEFILAEIR